MTGTAVEAADCNDFDFSLPKAFLKGNADVGPASNAMDQVRTGVRADEALERIDEYRSVRLQRVLVEACKLGIIQALRPGLQKTTPKRKRHLVHDPKVGCLHTRRRPSTKNMRFKPGPKRGACVRAHICIGSATWGIWVSRRDKDHLPSHANYASVSRWFRLSAANGLNQKSQFGISRAQSGDEVFGRKLLHESLATPPLQTSSQRRICYYLSKGMAQLRDISGLDEQCTVTIRDILGNAVDLRCNHRHARLQRLNQ